jgi:lipopolysaccharide export system permease protein
VASIYGVAPQTRVPSMRSPRRILPIMDGYILREMIPPFMFGLSAFLLFWVINLFFLAADYLINKGAPFFLVMRFLLYRIPQAAPLALPFSALFGALLGFTRLMADNEITALRTSGIPLSRIVRLPLVAGLVLFVAAYGINERITPFASDLSTRSFYQIVYKTATLPIQPHVFRSDPSVGKTFYINNVEPDGVTMDGVQIFEDNRAALFQNVITARTARIDGTNLVLKNATQITFKANGDIEAVAYGKNITVGLPFGQGAQSFFSAALNDPNTMDSKQLSQQIKIREATGQGGSQLNSDKITLASKLANPFASFIAIVIALPCAVIFGKKGRALGIAAAIVLLFLYYILGAMSAALGKNGAMDPYLAAWLPNIVVGITGLALIARAER